MSAFAISEIVECLSISKEGLIKTFGQENFIIELKCLVISQICEENDILG